MPSSRIEFPGHDGSMLAARLELPDGPPKACAILAHCFTCGKDIKAATRIARYLATRGMAVLRFDFTGLGSSEGDFANTNFSSNVQDLVKAADFMREHAEAPALLIGHSLGGAAVIAARPLIAEVKAVVTIGAPSDPAHVQHLIEENIDEIEENGEAHVTLAGRGFTIRKQFIEDVRSSNIQACIRSLDAALLIMHAPLDDTVSISNATDLFINAKHPKSFVSLDTADHLLTDQTDAEYAGHVIAGWVERYVSLTPAETVRPPKMKDAPVDVAETGLGKFQNLVKTGAGHEFVLDEPKSVGGEDTGPTPIELMMASLGACTNMTLRMYADRKGWDVGRISSHLEHEWVKRPEGNRSEKPVISKMTRKIHVEGNFTEDQFSRMEAIANKCPVHRALEGEPIIETHLDRD